MCSIISRQVLLFFVEKAFAESVALAADLPENWLQVVFAGPQVIHWSDASIHCWHVHGCRGRSVTGFTARRLERRLHCSTHQQSIWRPRFFSRCSSSLESAEDRPEDRILLDRSVQTPLENKQTKTVTAHLVVFWVIRTAFFQGGERSSWLNLTLARYRVATRQTDVNLVQCQLGRRDVFLIGTAPD